jgi:hypothetical protein
MYNLLNPFVAEISWPVKINMCQGAKTENSLR